ncbi:MAG: NHLP bacteriocin export ABC transporter permease/ATPase subunit [Oscillospiraceae bacterium]|nr:NHLP bacteriocin export ABC transporter permease/ATPase subunit [Oscillospiraceae bacterium]
MGWFDEQIRQRKEHDQDAFEEAFAGISDAVTGARISSALADDREKAKNAIDEILRYYHVKTSEVPETVTDTNEQLEYLLRPHGIMRRTVILDKGWYRDAIGAMLGVKKSDGTVAALIPTGLSGYSYFDTERGKWVKISRRNEALFEEEAIAFYKPFPLKKLNIVTLLKYIAGILSPADYILAALAALAATLVGMLTPKLNQLLFGTVIESGDMALLISIAVFMICVSVSSLLIGAVNSLIMARISTKMDITVQAATMARVMSLPASFFKDYGSGELSGRTQYINMLCSLLVSAVFSTGLTSLFSLVYITQIFAFAPALVAPALIIILATVLFSLLTTFVQMRISRRQMELSSKESGMSYALITGVQKIKLSGAEKRAFARWGKLYAKQAKMLYNPPAFIKYGSVITTLITLAGTFIMYYMAVVSNVSVADYYAFNAAYGMVSGAFMSLAGITLTIARIKPILHMAKPILDAVPEVSEGKQVITRLSGGIELNNVSFRYNENMPYVLDDLSLKIRPGQYVAIVGATGCGKSTLMRILLGFETPQKGAVYYDGKDLAGVDLRSLRRRIGTVMQNGKLFQGDIFSNIIISAPRLTMDEAWEAAELAGIAEDIRRMPMGMHTMISEGSGGVSGGQRQRLMIARAIAPKPKILMFDEATSALDNLTQKKVSESLDGLKCTRIVIAHRLSTIKQCDRIIYLEKGKIAEEGTYEELIAKKGKFAELVARQMV